MRAALLTLLLAPFLFYAGWDQVLHFRARKVSWAENIIHLALGGLLAAIITSVYRGRPYLVLGALALFAIAGGTDEFVFHRGLPPIESDIHAKEHLTLFMFIVGWALIDGIGSGIRPEAFFGLETR